MSETPLYQRLERAVTMIARHPFYPGKQEALDDCVSDLEERSRDGSLTPDQTSKLIALLYSEPTMEGARADRAMGMRNAR
jgi:hypothetical protein